MKISLRSRKIYILLVQDKHSGSMVIPYIFLADASAEFNQRCKLANAHYHTSEKAHEKVFDNVSTYFNIADEYSINLIERIIQ